MSDTKSGTLGLTTIGSIVIGLGMGSFAGWAFTRDAEARREERFLDECEWGPRTGVQADGTPAPRKPNLSFPICYQELVKARTVQTVVTLSTATAAPPEKPKAAPAEPSADKAPKKP